MKSTQKPSRSKSGETKSQTKRSPKILPAAPARFPIIGIGASAGGLEALELFLKNVPPASGKAFVVVQHMDPTYKGMMAELLQRITPMPVMQVKDRTRVKPDCVYVIPPNKDMSLLHGVLHLLDPIAPRGLRLPIDFFFRSLAEDQQDSSIAVVLSGMGSDGTLGLRAIKEKAGVSFVQDPASAKFDGMPNSAIEAGLADVIAPAEELPDRISKYFQQYHHNLARPGLPGQLEERESQSALEKVLIVLRAQTGHDFSLYKKSTVYRRIERRMRLHQIEKISTFVRFLQENPQEVEILFRELLIGVTSFFRDPETWDHVKTNVFLPLLKKGTTNLALRAWIPGCATGEEAYSLAILFKETLDEIRPQNIVSLQIFATDLDKYAIEKAREGVYPPNISADVTTERLERYFKKIEQGYQVTQSIREMVIFAPQNLIMDPPFSKLDILCCRNLLIYLTPEMQKKLIPLFHHCLNPDGYLFLGTADTVGTFTDLFSPIDRKIRLYRRLQPTAKKVIEFPITFIAPKPGLTEPGIRMNPGLSLQTQADQLLLQRFAPAAVLTTSEGDILYTSGRTGKYLEPSAGKANWNVFVMALDGLRPVLTSTFQKALRLGEQVEAKDVTMEGTAGNQKVHLSVVPLLAPGALQGNVMIIFTDVAARSEGRKKQQTHGDSVRIAELEAEIQQTLQDAQSVREEMQSSQEELTSANEELQSTNEELTSSKEEMQSMNEEMHTVNAELQTRLDELSRVNNDMKNLLDSTDIATLFLDNKLCVRRFTHETAKITRLIPTDVGRPITDIASALLYPELADDTRQVLRTLIRVERQIHTPDGNWFASTIMPYRTLENMIDGVVITFADITSYKNMEAELRSKTPDPNPGA